MFKFEVNASLKLPTSLNLFKNRHSYGYLIRSSHSSLFYKHDILFLHSLMCLFLTACADWMEPLEKAWRFFCLKTLQSPFFFVLELLGLLLVLYLLI